MHLQEDSSTGPALESALQQAKAPKPSHLPFGQNIALPNISGPTYLTGQTLVQQVAYSLSDKIFSYSPESFDLDIAAKAWHKKGEKNAHGYTTVVQSAETRTGAGSIALGYMFSKDFDLRKRHIPQSIVASSGSLAVLRPVLDELSLLYHATNPTTLHVAAVDFAARHGAGLVTDYTSAINLSEDLGLGLVASSSTFEMQHMALFATIMSSVLPSIHVYDGMSVAREITRVIDVLDQSALLRTCKLVLEQTNETDKKRLDNAGRVSRLLKSFNEELGTDYRPFEYKGHAQPETVIVVFGTVEASLTGKIVEAMANTGTKIGVINVRIYRPFIEEEFLQVLAPTVRHIAVLGQVKGQTEAQDPSEHSALYSDVLASLVFAAHPENQPAVYDFKYPRLQIWTPTNTTALIQQIAQRLPSAPKQEELFSFPQKDMLQYSFWDMDDSFAASAPVAIGELLSGDSKSNVTIRTGYDNLSQGGIVRTDIRTSTKSIEAAHSVTSADVAFVGSEKLLREFDVINSIKDGGVIVIKLEGFKKEESEKRISVQTRKSLALKKIQLLIFDPVQSQTVLDDPSLESFLLQLAFLQVARKDLFESGIKKLVGGEDALEKLVNDLDSVLYPVHVPESWLSIEPEAEKPLPLSQDLNLTSFGPTDKHEAEDAYDLRDWTAIAKGLAFKEAYSTATTLRPDLTVKTAVIHVKERRRLTPLTYDRNIFHIEFDLGDSGVKYDIGEALGIHAENDPVEVNEFIKWYGLNPDDVVEVPSREDPTILESRTVYQSLLQNVDIFGRPPKRFYEALSDFATDEAEKTQLLLLGTGGNQEAQVELKRRAEVDTVTYADILLEFPSAHPSFHDIVRIVSPMKRREYSIASSQKAQPNSVSLLIVTVGWVDPKGRDRFGQATRYLNNLKVGAPVTVSVKPSVMKLPPKTTAPIIMAGLGTGLAPFRAFVQERALQKQQGMEIGSILLYMGSRHQREEYLYGEEWEAYRDAGIITLMGCAFSRDQPQKIYIQDRMRESLSDIRKAYLEEGGAFYLCGPTWPVPDVTNVLEEAIEVEAKAAGKKTDPKRAIEELKEELRYVLEVY